MTLAGSNAKNDGNTPEDERSPVFAMFSARSEGNDCAQLSGIGPIGPVNNVLFDKSRVIHSIGSTVCW
jgi:hypothetical protein